MSLVYGVSPKLQSELLNNQVISYINYSHVGNYSMNDKYTIPIPDESVNLQKVLVSSNGTHIEIKLLFNDFLNRLYTFLNSNDTKKSFFVNVLIDSDDDESTGFLGYDYRYLISSNISDSYNSRNDGIQYNLITNISNSENKNYSNYKDLLNDNEFNDLILRTSNSKNIVEKIDWTITGYELLDYDFQSLFYYSKLNEKHMTIIPNGFKITLDLKQIEYPPNYAILVEVGRNTDNYKLTHTYGKIHIPTPNLNLDQQDIGIVNGKNSIIMRFNNTSFYNLNLNIQILNKTIPEGISLNFRHGNSFDLLGGHGAIPLDILVHSKDKGNNIIVPINISYSVIGANDFAGSDFNNSLTREHIYNMISYLNLNLQNGDRLVKLGEIPSQYVAIILGAIFSFFIPSIAKSIKEYKQKQTANKFLKNILKEEDSKNTELSIKNIIANMKIIKNEFIKGKINKDQYEILKENTVDILKDLINKNTSNRESNKEKQ